MAKAAAKKSPATKPKAAKKKVVAKTVAKKPAAKRTATTTKPKVAEKKAPTTTTKNGSASSAKNAPVLTAAGHAIITVVAGERAGVLRFGDSRAECLKNIANEQLWECVRSSPMKVTKSLGFEPAVDIFGIVGKSSSTAKAKKNAADDGSAFEVEYDIFGNFAALRFSPKQNPGTQLVFDCSKTSKKPSSPLTTEGWSGKAAFEIVKLLKAVDKKTNVCMDECACPSLMLVVCDVCRDFDKPTSKSELESAKGDFDVAAVGSNLYIDVRQQLTRWTMGFEGSGGEKMPSLTELRENVRLYYSGE